MTTLTHIHTSLGLQVEALSSGQEGQQDEEDGGMMEGSGEGGGPSGLVRLCACNAGIIERCVCSVLLCVCLS